MRAASLSALLSSASSGRVTSDAARPCGPSGTASVRARDTPRVTHVPRRACVRLEVRGSGYLIEPRGASCKVTHVSCVAPGDAPAFLVNRLAWQRTAMVLKVRALVLADSS